MVKFGNIKISKATKLWIHNDVEQESNFYGTIKLWHKIDKETNITSYLTIETKHIS